jgi:hypothetical protein
MLSFLKKSDKFDEFDFLDIFFQKMLREGKTYNLIHLSVNASMVEHVYDETKISVTENDLQRVANFCIANNWVKQTTVTSQYGGLQLTTTGVGIVKSKQKQKELLKNRSIMKKTSDYIEDHKGLFILLGFILALATLLLKYYGG